VCELNYNGSILQRNPARLIYSCEFSGMFFQS
jgi:hypothetical protein